MDYPFTRLKGNTFTNAFQKVPDETNYKPNNIWVKKAER